MSIYYFCSKVSMRVSSHMPVFAIYNASGNALLIHAVQAISKTIQLVQIERYDAAIQVAANTIANVSFDGAMGVTGASFSSTLRAGMEVKIQDDSDDSYRVIQAVDSDGSLRLLTPYGNPVTGTLVRRRDSAPDVHCFTDATMTSHGLVAYSVNSDTIIEPAANAKTFEADILTGSCVTLPAPLYIPAGQSFVVETALNTAEFLDLTLQVAYSKDITVAP